MSDSPNHNCPHITGLISLDTFNSLNFSDLKCKNCDEKSDLWICLMCGESFCSKNKNLHFYLHSKDNKNHCIGINILDLSIWCYNCTTNDSNAPGSYIESEVTNKYAEILYSKKQSSNANKKISFEERNKIKFENFLELLHENRIKKGICFIGPYIYEQKNNINFYQEGQKDVIKKVCEKHGLNENEIDIKKLFKEKPELLYEYLSNFNLDIAPNKVHMLIKGLVDSGTIQTILTENIDNYEKLMGIPEEKIINIEGKLFGDICVNCNEKIDINELKECIKSGKVNICKKCNNPYEPNILFANDNFDKDLYEKIIYKDNYDVVFIIGSNLNKKLFSSIIENLSYKNNWIIYINQTNDSKVNFDFDYDFSRHIYLPFNYIENIYYSLKICHFTQQVDFNLEQFIAYTEGKDGIVSSPFLNNMRIGNIFNFNKYSIFDSNFKIFENDIKFIHNLMINFFKTKKIEPKLNLLESGSIGSMLGMAIADAMGHRYEFEPVRYNKITLTDMGEGPGGAFQLLPGQWTDDTSMGLCIADSLIMKNGQYDAHDLMQRFLAWWNSGYNNAFRFDYSQSHSVGLGGQISASLFNYIVTTKKETSTGDINSSGIGSIMRNAAVPICYHNNIEKAMDVAKRQSLSTHHGNEAAECCRLLTYIIIKILNRKDEKLNDIIGNLEKFDTEVNSVKCLALSKEESDNPDRDWNWKKKDFHYSPTRSKQQPGYIGSYAMDGMAMALHVVYYTNSFREAIIQVVNLRGDSDSVGAVVGQIAGAYYGIENIPPEWVEAVSKWENFEIPLRGYVLQKLIK